jgi:hypothetical protein
VPGGGLTVVVRLPAPGGALRERAEHPDSR